jgi:glycosyltransferase involved in cell wall biosynthesis
MEFIGRVPYDRLLNELADSDILIHPSLEETFGMSVAEAMALGIPVIGGAHSGAVPWVVGEGGALTDVTSPAAIEQATLELLDNPLRYRAAAEAAQARVRNCFTGDRVAEAYDASYRQIAVAHRESSCTTPIRRMENRGQP